MSFGCWVSSKNQRNFVWISVLAYQKSSIILRVKIKSSNLWFKGNLYFWFDLFLEARAESLQKFVGFLIDLKTTKGRFEINWPLVWWFQVNFNKIENNWYITNKIVIENPIFLPIDVENHSGFRWFISQVGYGIGYVIPFILRGSLTISGLLLICFLFWGKFQTYWQFICATVLFFLFILISDNFWYGFLIGMFKEIRGTVCFVSTLGILALSL